MRQRRHERVLGYARVSSEDQALGTSLQDQQDVMTRHAASLGLKVARFFVESESGGRAKEERRAEMQSLLKVAKAGDLVLCDKVDRWSRDPEFTYRTMRELLERDVSVFFVGDNVDPSTHDGDTNLNFRVLFAREEHKRIKLRLVGTRKKLRDKGLFVEGTTPWGYRRQAGTDRESHNVLVIDEAEAEKIRRAFAMCIAGKTITEIAEALDATRDRVADALHRRLYLGEIEDGAEDRRDRKWIRGKHPAIIDARTFQAAQGALVSRMNGSRSPLDGSAETADWWLRDVAVCGLCGAKMGAAYAGPKGKGRRYYFRCTAKCTSRFVKVSEAQDASEILVFHRLYVLQRELSAPAVVKVAPVVDLRDRRAKLERRREKYTEMYADGLTSRDELRTQLGKLDAERTRLDALDVPAPPTPSAATLKESARLAGQMASLWMRMPEKYQRIAIGRLAVSVGLAAGRDPNPVWRDAAEVDLSEVADLLTR